MIWQATEWQGSSGSWYCNCLDNLAGGYGAWFMPARILDITPAEFLTLLITEFKPDNISISEVGCFVTYSWKSQSAMRKWKNWINKQARERKFEIC